MPFSPVFVPLFPVGKDVVGKYRPYGYFATCEFRLPDIVYYNSLKVVLGVEGVCETDYPGRRIKVYVVGVCLPGYPFAEAHHE